MGFNRLLYLTALAAAAIFFLASGTWFSWILLLILAALPWVSLLTSLPAIRKLRLHAQLPERTEVGANTVLHLWLTGLKLLPLPEARLRINLRSRDQEKDVRYLSRLSRSDGVLPLDTDHCGFLEPSFLKKCQVYDSLGLFRFRLRTPQLHRMAILPEAVKPDPMPDLESFLNLQMKPKPGGGFAEVHDHRPYRPGDPVKDIHWKLSLKTEELIVREPLEPARRRIVLALATPTDPETRDRGIGELRWLCGWLFTKGIRHTLAWMDGTALQTREIASEADVDEAVAAVCCAEPDTAPLPSPLPLRADWLYVAGQGGGAK